MVLRKNVRVAFDERKKQNLLISNQLLVHFDPDLPMVLACDAFCGGLARYCLTCFPTDQRDLSATHPGLFSRRRSPYSQIER